MSRKIRLQRLNFVGERIICWLLKSLILTRREVTMKKKLPLQRGIELYSPAWKARAIFIRPYERRIVEEATRFK